MKEVLFTFAGVWLCLIAVSVFMLVCSWRVYTKLGIEGWKCLIPIYNQYCLIKALWEVKYFLGIVFGWVALVLLGVLTGLVPVFGIILGIALVAFTVYVSVVACVLNMRMCVAFGYPGWLGLLMLVVPLVSVVMFAIWAFKD